MTFFFKGADPVIQNGTILFIEGGNHGLAYMGALCHLFCYFIVEKIDV